MKKKIKAVADKVMQLDFFAKRFGFNPNNVFWALVRCFNEDGDETVIPAVYVGDDLYIDILKDELHCLNNVGGCVSVYNQACVTKTPNNFLFKSDKATYKAEKSAIYNLYKHKFVYPEIVAEAKCLN